MTGDGGKVVHTRIKANTNGKWLPYIDAYGGGIDIHFSLISTEIASNIGKIMSYFPLSKSVKTLPTVVCVFQGSLHVAINSRDRVVQYHPISKETSAENQTIAPCSNGTSKPLLLYVLPLMGTISPFVTKQQWCRTFFERSGKIYTITSSTSTHEELAIGHTNLASRECSHLSRSWRGWYTDYTSIWTF